jgi:sulfur carrier protein
MEIIVNGEKMEVQISEPKVLDALRLVGLDENATGIAIALNMELVTKAEWASTRLQPGDELEVITARQGG